MDILSQFLRFFRLPLWLIFLFGLGYVLLPGPSTINDFPPLPGSVKSDLAGDTWQIPNVVGYFSNFDRKYITSYYSSVLSDLLVPGIRLPVIKLNHRPEYAYDYIKQYTESTFLEEYIFPMRESIFVNGYEPKVENDIYKVGHDFIRDHIIYHDGYYSSKETLRFYPSGVVARVAVYLGIWLSIFALWVLFNKVLKEQFI